MRETENAITANLLTGSKTLLVDAKYTSKYSLLVRFPDGVSATHGTEFQDLTVGVNGERIHLGPCRLFSEPNIDGYGGRLVFTNDLYDFESLLIHRKVVKLRNSLIDLPMVLSHKERIHREFKEITADLAYDLSVYKNFFDKLDNEYQSEPEQVKTAIQNSIIDIEGRSFISFLDKRNMDLFNLVRNYARDDHERHGFYFRKQLWNYIVCSVFMTRTNLKPRGYSGDSSMMMMIYKNEYEGDSTFSKLLNKHPLEQPGAEAVRNRRRLIADTLAHLANDRRSGREGLRVLSVACGPAFELNDILAPSGDFDKYDFTLLDQDRSALLEAATLVDALEKRFKAKLRIAYLNESVRTMLGTPELKTKWGEFDFIYSMGLFDYLTPPVATAILDRLCDLLRPGGEMLVGNFHISNPSRCYMEYWCDWVLYYRTEEEFFNLLKDRTDIDKEIFYEKTGVQMFLHMSKK